jgi:hypothetical protein
MHRHNRPVLPSLNPVTPSIVKRSPSIVLVLVVVIVLDSKGASNFTRP